MKSTERVRRLLAFVGVLSLFVLSAARAADDTPLPDRLAEQESPGGLAVVLGTDGGELAASLHEEGGYVVHVLDADMVDVESVRQHLSSRGLYGPVSVERWSGDVLPYRTNLVNLLVVREQEDVSRTEMMRALAPEGALYRERYGTWTAEQRNRPDDLGEWSHFLHDATNNAVTQDERVGPPRHVQWVGSRKYLRHHGALASISGMISAGGKVFYVVDRAPAASILLKPDWYLVARDAFSGARLWDRSIESWANWRRNFRGGPVQLPRKMVATEDRVYATLGIGSPVVALDAATGETRRTYGATENAEEMLYDDGTLYVLVGLGGGRKKGPEAPTHRVMAVDAETGDTEWARKERHVMPLTLAADDRRVFYQTAEDIVCLGAGEGREMWSRERTTTRDRPSWSAPTLVVQDGVVLSADRNLELEETRGGKGNLVALSAEAGSKLWESEAAEGFHSPIDVFVIDDETWVGRVPVRQGPDFQVARDLNTGEVTSRLSTEEVFSATMTHHRCYRNKATSRYILAGRAGVEYINVNSGNTVRHHWVRGTCQYGIMPANGLLYVPPHACACYIRSKMAGFFALAPEGESDAPTSDAPRLQRGKAYEADVSATDEAKNGPDWPRYRNGPARRGETSADLPTDLTARWRASVGDEVSPPVVADGKVFAAAVDAHTLQARSADGGTLAWSFTAGGRIDSPPTVHAGRVVFGSADGSVYCLRASDGALCWRFRAAPRQRRLMDRGRLESAWPVHGSVLVDGSGDRPLVYFAAGRSSYIDGGVHLYCLDLRTGKVVSHRNIYSRDPESGKQPDEPRPYEMPGAKPDVLSLQDGRIYMRHRAFTKRTLESAQARPHLYCPTGFRDDTWWHRTYWIFGTHFYAGAKGWFFAGREVPSGRIMAHDGTTIYGYGRAPHLQGKRGEYRLFAAPLKGQTGQGEIDWRKRWRQYHRKDQFKLSYRWKRKVPLLTRALVLTDDKLVIAGPPDNPDKRGFSKAAWNGEEGGKLQLVSTKDGNVRRTYETDWIPVFDGMAVAGDAVYVSTAGGELVCMEARQDVKE